MELACVKRLEAADAGEGDSWASVEKPKKKERDEKSLVRKETYTLSKVLYILVFKPFEMDKFERSPTEGSGRGRGRGRGGGYSERGRGDFRGRGGRGRSYNNGDRGINQVSLYFLFEKQEVTFEPK